MSDAGEEGEGRTERRRDRYLRRARRVALTLILGLLGLLVLGAVAARSYLTEERSRLLAVEVFDSLFQGRLELGRLEWERFPERLHLEEVVLFAPRGERVITIREATAEVKLVPLLWKTVHLPEVRLEGVSVELLPAQEEEPSFALIEVFLPRDPGPETDEDAPPSGWSVSLSDIAVKELEVTLKVGEFSAEVEQASFESGSLELGLPGAEVRVGALELPRGRVGWEELGWVVRPARVESLRYSRGADGGEADFELEEIDLLTEGLALRGRVRLGDLFLDRPWTLKASLDGELDLDAPALAGVLSEVVEGQVLLRVEAAGTLDDPSLELRAQTAKLKLGAYRFENLETSARLAAGELFLSSLKFTHAGGEVEGSGTARLLPIPGAYQAKLEIKELPGAFASTFGAPPEWLPKKIGARFSLEGDDLLQLDTRFRGTARLKGMPTALPSGLPEELSVETSGRVNAQRLRLAPTTLKFGTSRATVEGKVVFDAAKALDLKTRLTISKLESVLAPFGLAGVRGEAQIDGQVQGAATTPTVAGQAELSGLVTPWVPPVSGSVPFGWNGTDLKLEDARLSLARGAVRLDGTIGVLDASGASLPTPAAELRFETVGLDLERLGLEGIEGLVDASGELRGTLEAPSGRARVEVREGKVGTFRLLKAEATVFGDGRNLQLTEARIMPEGGGELVARGSVNPGEETLALVVDVTALPLGLAQAFLPETQLEGVVGAHLEAAGPWSNPEISGPVGVTGLEIAWLELGTLAAQVQGTRSALGLDATLESPAGRLTAKGTLIDDGSAVRSMRVETRSLALAPFLPPEAAPPEGEAPLPPMVEGRVVGDLSLEGAWPLPEIRGRLRATGLSYRGQRIPGGDATVLLGPAPDGLNLSVAALGVLDATARLTYLEESLVLKGDGSLRRFSVGSALPVLAEYETELVTAGTFQVDVVGSAWSVESDLSLLDLTLVTGVMSARDPVHLTVSDSGLRVAPFVLEGAGGRFEAGGEWGEQLNFVARGVVDLSIIPPFVTAISRASGQLSVDLQARGTLDAPDLRGELTLAGPALLRPRSVVREVRLSEGTIELTGTTALLQGFVGEIGSGFFSASGRLDLSGEQAGAHRFSIRAEGLPLRLPDLVLEVNGLLRVEGTLPETQVSGELEVVRGRYLQKFELKRFNFQAQQVDLDEPLSATYPWLEGIDLDLHAVSAGGLEVVANAGPFSLELLLDSDLQIQGTAAEPVIEGKVLSSQGSIAFPAATLQVGEARIDFEPSGGQGIAPVLNLRAEGEVTPPLTAGGDSVQPTYFVTLGLSGDPFGEMPLTLTSDPALSQLEVLSLLTTGRVSPSMGANGTGIGGGGDAAIAFAGSQLAEPLTRFVTQQLERNLNLDLQLDAGITSTGVTVSAGKEITRRLRLEGSFQRTLESQSVAVGRARFLLSDRLFLEYTGESVTGQASGAGSLTEGNSNRLELKLRLLGK